MSALNPISLAIRQPVHAQSFVATGAATTVTVPLRAEIVATTAAAPAALFRKWYSNLAAEPLGALDQINAVLSVGSHTITYTVKDKNEDGVLPAQLEPLFKSIEHFGATGGPPVPPPADGKPCVIHVLVANLLTPVNLGNLSKASAVLEAEAPLPWGKYVKDAFVYPERDPNYHATNKVRYRWFFRRIAPAGPVLELDVQGGNAMTLIPPHPASAAPPLPKVDPPPRLRYSGALPAAVVVGQQYSVTLRVEHADTPAQGHEVSRTVTIVA